MTPAQLLSSGRGAPLSFAVVHPGTQHSWQVALAMQKLGRLAFYATSIFYQPDRWPYRIERYLPGPLRRPVHREFTRFAKTGLDPALVRTGGLAEWAERLAARAGARRLARRIDGYGNARFGTSMGAALIQRESLGVWGFDNSSRELFRSAKAAGRVCVLDRTCSHGRTNNETVRQLCEQYGEFVGPNDYTVSDRQIAHNDEEFELADSIVVGSPFAAATIRDNVPEGVASNVRVLEYCYDEALFGGQPPPRLRDRDEPLRFLFVGQVSARKGIHLALKVFERIPRSAARLLIVGEQQIPSDIFARYADRVEWRPPVPRAEVPGIMAGADLLLMPSYIEGSAVSLLEGLASGLGIIQTEAAGCGATQSTGLRLPLPSEGALYEAVMTAIEARDRVAAWRANAQEEAKRYSFDSYVERIRQALSNLE